MREPVKIDVDGKAYSVSKYGATKGLKLFFRLSKILGEPLLKAAVVFFDKAPKGRDKKDLKTLLESTDVKSPLVSGFIESVAGGLFEKIYEDDAVATVKEILSQTFEYGTSITVIEDFDTRFQGSTKHLFVLVGKTLSAQYADFFGSPTST